MRTPELVSKFRDDQTIKHTYGAEWDHRPEKSLAVTYSLGRDDKEFTILEVNNDYSPCWATIKVGELKSIRGGKTRYSEHSIQITRRHLLHLAANMLKIADQLKGDRDDEKIVAAANVNCGGPEFEYKPFKPSV